MAKKKKGFKFSFGTDFQEHILQYIVTGEKGYKALELLDDGYFTLISHSIIALGIKKYYKRKKNVPGKAYLREFLREIYEKELKQLQGLSDQDKESVEECLDRVYEKKVDDEDMVLDKVINFAKYVRFKEEVESIDMDNYESYEAKIKEFNTIQNIGKELKEDYGVFLVGGMPDRAHKRVQDYAAHPTPFWQLNKTLNSGGTAVGNLICAIAEEKRFKTGLLINVALGYLRRKMKGIYFDFENGQASITLRSEQGISNHTREEILSEKFDDKILKLMRKYKRIGSELNIKRFPSLSATTDDMQAHVDKLKRDFGFEADFCIVDYGFLLGAKSGKTDDFGRISDAFLDLKNFADFNKFQCLWTVAHVTREAVDKRRATIYKPTDIAKCIDVPRHIDILMGLQESEEEKQEGVIRLEILEQRDGVPGKILFWVDHARQKLNEFTKGEVAEYIKQIRGLNDEEAEEKPKRRRSKEI